MDKKTVLIPLMLTLLCAAGFWTFSASAADATPGSDGDPVVTKSYVDMKINQALGGGGTTGAMGSEELMAQIEYVVKNQVGKAEGNSFTPVSVEMGKTIYGGEGCEMILRSGQGLIVTSTDAVVNATSGTDLKNGVNAPKNSLLIFPRDDGRGIKATDSCWFLVKGAYTIN